jgi:hypothetical protein
MSAALTKSRSQSTSRIGMHPDQPRLCHSILWWDSPFPAVDCVPREPAQTQSENCCQHKWAFGGLGAKDVAAHHRAERHLASASRISEQEIAHHPRKSMPHRALKATISRQIERHFPKRAASQPEERCIYLPCSVLDQDTSSFITPASSISYGDCANVPSAAHR